MKPAMMKMLMVILAICGWQAAGNAQSNNMQNDSSILQIADPTIFRNANTYYLYGTVDRGANAGFLVYTSKDLKTWQLSPKNDGFALKKGEAFGDKGFWAPQIFAYRKKFYMAYVANEEIAIAESDDPAGPFTQKNKVSLAAPVKQIDPFVYFENGKIYLYHVRLTKGNRIFVGEMNEDLTAVKESTVRECLSSVLPWENTTNADWPVAEGPTVFKRGKLYYLFYSSNDFRNPEYAVGYATSASPMGPWKKHEGNPVISRSMLKLNGPGHGDFFEDNKKQLYYVLHTHNSTSRVAPRKTAILKVSFSGPGGSFVADIDSFSYLRK